MQDPLTPLRTKLELKKFHFHYWLMTVGNTSSPKHLQYCTSGSIESRKINPSKKEIENFQFNWKVARSRFIITVINNKRNKQDLRQENIYSYEIKRILNS